MASRRPSFGNDLEIAAGGSVEVHEGPPGACQLASFPLRSTTICLQVPGLLSEDRAAGS